MRSHQTTSQGAVLLAMTHPNVAVIPWPTTPPPYPAGCLKEPNQLNIGPDLPVTLSAPDSGWLPDAHCPRLGTLGTVPPSCAWG